MIKVITEDMLTIDESKYNREAVLQLLEDYSNVKVGILNNNKVTKILSYNDILTNRDIPEGCLIHCKQIFEEALAIYTTFDNREGLCIPVYNNENELEYILQYERNRINDKEEGYVREFLKYDINDKNIDLDLLKRADVFIFHELEEYTYQIVRVILKNFPEKHVFFTDKKASLFFQNENVVITNLNEIYLKYIRTGNYSVMIIDSNKDFGPHNPSRFLFKTYHSLEVMTSLFWSCHRTSFGEKNADKTYLWIHSPLGSEHGFTDLIKYPLFKAIMANEKGIIPVIDLSVKNDNNLFSFGNGDNVWEYYMYQPFNISVDDVMKSKNVIIHDCTIMDRFNPFNMEVEYFIDWKEMLNKYWKLNTETINYINYQCEKYVNEREKILGVIGHPPHYGAAVEVYKFMEPHLFFEVVKKEFSNGGYDKIFLNTEDEDVFKQFSTSELKEHLIYIPQRRTSKNEFYIDGKVVSSNVATQIVAGDENLRERELRYLSIIFILSKCHMLMSSGNCGAIRLAHALHQGDEQNLWVYNG